MRISRAILALLLALLWWPITNSCLIAATLPGQFPALCESACENSGKNEQTPHGSNDCTPCATLESGVNLSALTPAVAPAPLWCENDEFAQFMQRLMAAIAEESKALPPLVSQWSPPPRHSEFLTVALPVRGPSFLA